MKFYICKTCGKIIAIVNETAVPTMCCGQKMEEIVPGTTDAAVEKHVPVFEVKDQKVFVTVGEVAHPMIPEHFIEWIYLLTDKGGSFRFLKPGEAPKADFALVEGEKPIEVYAYCNLHGLWKSAI
jgi:superoxide reductase